MLDLTADIIQLEDITDRVDELEAEQPLADDDDLAELDELKGILDDLRSYGGDHWWDGDWFPGYLIHEDHFTEYAQELSDDLHGDTDQQWPFTCIDWEKAADELLMDYSQTDINGTTYYYR